MVNNTGARFAAAGIELPHVPAVQTGNLLFLTGMLPTVGHEAKFLGRDGRELNAEHVASELLRDILGKDKMSTRLVFGLQSLPLGVSVEVEAIFEVSA